MLTALLFSQYLISELTPFTPNAPPVNHAFTILNLKAPPDVPSGLLVIPSGSATPPVSVSSPIIAPAARVVIAIQSFRWFAIFLAISLSNPFKHVIVSKLKLFDNSLFVTELTLLAVTPCISGATIIAFPPYSIKLETDHQRVSQPFTGPNGHLGIFLFARWFPKLLPSTSSRSAAGLKLENISA